MRIIPTIKSSHRILALGFLLGSAWPTFFQASAAPVLPKEQVPPQYRGQVIQTNEAPELYQIVNSVFDPLAKAQTEYSGHSLETSLTLIKSPEINAFVLIDKPGKSPVFITTGLLDALLKDATTASGARNGLTGLAGVIAHELAHPLEAFEVQGRTRPKIGGQASEVYADTVGSKLAERAEFPRESVWSALKNLFWSETPIRSSVEIGDLVSSATGTHPQQRVRRTTNEIALTLARYDQGVPTTAMLDQLVQAGVNPQALDFLKKARPQPFQLPSSLEELKNRYRQLLPAEGTQDTPQRLEERRLLLRSLHREIDLRGKSGQLHPGALNTIRNIQEMVLQDESLASSEASSATLPSLKLNPKNTPPELKPYLDIYRNQERIPFFREPGQKKWATTRVEGFLKNGLPQLLGDRINQSLLILPSSQASLVFEKTQWLDEPLKNSIQAAQNSNSRGILEDFYYQHYAKLPYFAQGMIKFPIYEKTVEQFSMSQILAMMNDGHAGRILPFLPLPQSNTPIYSRKFPEILAQRRKIFEKVWENRGLWATVDLMSGLTKVTWEEIWKELGIDLSRGKSELIHAVQAFTKTPAYAELLEAQSKSNSPYTITPKWANSTLFSYLRGDNNPGIQNNESLRQIARKTAATLFARDQNFLDRLYSRSFNDAAGSHPSVLLRGSNSEVLERLQALSEKISADLGTSVNHRTTSALIKAIDQSGWKLEDRKKALQILCWENKSALWKDLNSENKHDTISILKRNGLFPSALDALDGFRTRALSASPSNQTDQSEFLATYRDLTNTLASELQSEFKALAAKEPRDIETLLRFSETLFNPYRNFDFRDPRFEDPRLAKLQKQLLEVTQGWGEDPHFSIPQKLLFFRNVAASGSSTASDEFYRLHLQKHIERDAHFAEIGQQLLYDRAFSSGALSLETAKQVNEEGLAQLARESVQGRASKASIQAFFEWLDYVVPQASLAKDQYLESIAWRLGLSGDDLQEFIEKRKSTNWKSGSRKLVNSASVAGTFFDSLDGPARSEFLDYLLDPSRGPVPKSVEKQIDHLIPAAGHTEEAKGKLIQILRESSSNERIPLIQYLIASGPQAPAHSPDFPYNIIREKLGYPPGSLQEKLLAAFLRTVPEHERTSSLAYLMSLPQGEQTSIKAIFEVFSSVGIKFGQMASIWNLFGDDISKELKSLKDDAAPLSKARIESILDEAVKRGELTPEMRKGIRLKRILGSASIKTVVEAEITLRDGSRKSTALLIQRPHAESLIRTNLDLSKRYIEEVRREGVKIPGGMFDTLIDDLNLQMNRELDLKAEAANLKKASRFYQDMNRELAPQLHGYRFSVPQPVPDIQPGSNFLFVELGKGVNWEKLPAFEKKIVGPNVVDSTLLTFYKTGWIDADRHGANFLFDPLTKTIRVIDVGQAEQLSKRFSLVPDDIYRFSQLLRAVNEKDAASISKLARQMARKGSSLPSQRVLRQAIAKWLEQADLEKGTEKWVSLINSLSEAGLKLDSRFTLSALKGHMTLAGEGYVSPEEFEKRVEERVRNTLLKDKRIVTAVHEISKSCPALVERLREKLNALALPQSR